MSHDAILQALIGALQQSLSEPGEQRLFRSGKLPGLFATRSGTNAEAAKKAFKDGLLELVRTDDKGKHPVEWVRPTPAGVSFLHAHESPRAVLEELKSTLQSTAASVPAWLSGMRQDLQSLTERLEGEMQRLLHRIDALTARVDEALRRQQVDVPMITDGVARLVPWAAEVLHYLDHRRQSGATGDCSLPELFRAMRQRRPDISLAEFHEGLRRLDELHSIYLQPYVGRPEDLTQPEFALLDGAAVLYYASRR